MRTALSLNLYLIISGSIFLGVGILHLFRLLYRWPILVGSYPVPHVLSVIGFPVATAYVWAVVLLGRK